MTPLRVLIVDDEKLARSRLRRLLGGIDDVIIVGERDRGDAVAEALREGAVDVLLLDIEMPGLTGLEAIGLLPSRGLTSSSAPPTPSTRSRPSRSARSTTCSSRSRPAASSSPSSARAARPRLAPPRSTPP